MYENAKYRSLSRDHYYYRGIKWFSFDDDIYELGSYDKFRFIVGCKCSRIYIDENENVISERNIILTFLDWTIPERISVHSEKVYKRKNGKIVEPIQFIKRFIKNNEIRYDEKESFYIRARDVYGYGNHSKDKGDKLYLMRFKSLRDYYNFKRISEDGL